MAFDYAGMAAIARELIADVGREVVLIRQGSAPADPANPHRGPAVTAEATLTVTAAMFVEGESESGTLGVRRGTAGAALVAAPTSGEDLRLYDHLNDGGVLYRITGVNPLRPGPSRLLYALELGGGA